MRRNIEISISKKFSNYCLTACLILLFYITYSFIDQQYNRNKQAILNGSSETILAHREIEDSIKYASAIIQNISKEVQKNPHSKQYISDTLKKFRILYSSEELTSILSISMFSWVGADQKLSINSEFGVLSNPVDLSTRDYIPLTIKEPKKVHIGAPVVGAVSKQHLIPFGIGIVDKNGIYQGTIVAGINIYGIYKKIIATGQLQHSSMQIIFNKATDIISEKAVNRDKALSHIVFDKNTVQLLKDFPLFNSGNAVLYKNIDNSKYGVLVTLDNKYNDQHYLKKNYLIQAVSISLIFLFLILFFRKIFIQPITKLSNLAKNISNGNTNIRIPRSSIKEINKLAKTITEIKDFVAVENALKVKLGQAIQSKESLINATSHDLRNYISGISGLVDIMLESRSDDELNKNKNLELLNIISNQSKELMYFVEDLLDTNRVGSNDLQLSQIEEIDFSKIIDRLILLNKSLLLKNKAEALVDIQSELPKFYGDTRRIKQILNNLITNAVKYSPQYSSISISVTFITNMDRFCIKVKDGGIGMTDDEIKLALSGQGESIDKSGLNKKIDSHGVGMTIIKDLVELHQGKLEIESKKGIGSTFKVLLPTLKKNVNPSSSSDSNPIQNFDKNIIASLKGKTILIADDEPINIMVLSGRLSKNYDLKVKLAENGSDLFDIYKNSIVANDSVDFIISDINMPKINGIEAAKKIREYEKKNNLKQVPIIAYCGDSDQNIFSDLKESGINGIFVKGDDLTNLIKELYKLSKI